jgi:hypothetical protein
MGLFTPKYPKSDTPGASAAPPKRESRADRREREYLEFQRQRLADDFARSEAEMAERDRRRAEATERFNRRRNR